MNQLTTFLLAVFARTTLFSQTINIPDAFFLEKLIEAGVDVNNNGTIQAFEATAVKVLDVSKTDTLVNISSLAGIERFVNLETLDCSGHILLTNLLAFPQNKKLKKLFISDLGGGLKTVDLSANIELEELDCSTSNVESIDITQNLKLRNFVCHTNELSVLDLTKNVNLLNLYCYENYLSSIDVSQNTNLRNLNCNLNGLKELDVTGNPLLRDLTCGQNAINELDLSKNDSLRTLYCYFNSLLELDLSNNKALRQIWCSRNRIQALDLSNNPKLNMLFCNINRLSSLSITHLKDLQRLSCGTNNIIELDYTQNLELRILDVSHLSLDSMDVRHLAKLENLYCSYTDIPQLDLTKNPELVEFHCIGNDLSEIDLSHNIFLEVVDLTNNYTLKKIDINKNPFVRELTCSNNFDLKELYMRNGSSQVLNLKRNNDLEFICGDDFEVEYLEYLLDSLSMNNVLLPTDCETDIPEGFHKVVGRTNLEFEQISCKDRSRVLEVKYHITNDTFRETQLASFNGLYNAVLKEGSYKIVPNVMNAPYYKVTPDSISFSFPKDGEVITTQFCVSPKLVVQDLNLALYPTNRPRPGSKGNYKIKITNNGTTVESGQVRLGFSDERISLLTESPSAQEVTENGIVWEFADLEPFESLTYCFSALLSGPQDNPALNGGDVIKFYATITPTESDFRQADNFVELCQRIRNSYDPNDKTCLQGDAILEERIGEYAFYKIRFENTGSAEAIDIFIKDAIDLDRFDINTLQITASSHPVKTQIVDGNIVEFHYKGINLPFDVGENTGFVIFKLRTLSTLVLGDKFENSAEIYFDNNLPIYTNTASTTIISEPIEEPIGDKNFLLKVFPNPSAGVFIISSSEDIQEYYIYDLQGRVVDRAVYSEAIRETMTLQLDSGLYMVQVITEEGIEVKKALVEQ